MAIRFFQGLTLAMFVGWTSIARPSTITIVNLDGAGEGFNDPTPVAAIGGNPGVTIGQQRLNVFNRAAELWSARLISTVPIRVGARFDPLACTSSTGILGSAGPVSIFRDFSGAPLANTYYAGALANALAGSDLNANGNDIDATFNSSVGQSSCLSSLSWYYGLDGNAPSSSINLLDTVMHELAHGLGFISTVDLASGMKLNGADDAFSVDLEDHTTGKLFPAMTDAERVAASKNTGNLHWIGTNVVALSGILSSGRSAEGHVQMYAPSVPDPGSSVSHFSTALFPDELMEPFAAPTTDSRLAQELLKDLGWKAAPFRPNVVTNGATLLAEYCAPTNHAIDPGETVVVAFSLKNAGPGNALSIVATLLSSGGVTSPSDPQGFGSLPASGPAQSRNFVFTANGSCGGTLIATLQLQDGTNDLGTVTFPFALGRGRSFANTTRISIPSTGAASPYPSAITVSGLPPGTPPPTVTLIGLSHPIPDDLDVLLVGPGGQMVLLMSDTGGGNSLSSVTLSFADDAAGPLPDASAISSGTYLPTDFNPGDVFPAPAPPGPYGTSLSVFADTDPNGQWNLFIVDDSAPRSGNVAGGWSLTFRECCSSTGPVLVMASGPTNYVENAPPVLLDANALVSDPNSADFAGGRLTAALTENGTDEDRLGVRNQGSGAGQIGVAGDTITYGGALIGTVSGTGNALSPLVVEFTTPDATPAAVQALARNLTFANVSDGPATLPRTVGLFLVDDTGGTNVPAAKTITVTALNDAPILDVRGNPTLPSILEDTPGAANPGILVGSLLGTATSDPDPGALRGIAITAVSSGAGAWQFSTNAGLTWRSVGATSEGNARLLPDAPGSLLRLFPNTNFYGTASITYRAWDRTQGLAGGLGNASLNGGTGAYSSASETASIMVDAVNDKPTLDPLNPLSLQEDAGPLTVPFSGVRSGANNELQLLTVLATSSNPFLIPDPAVSYTSPGAAGSIQLMPTPGAHGTAVLTLTVMDDGGTANGGVDIAFQSFQVSIMASNHAPILAPVGDLTLIEGDTLSLTNRATDADLPADHLTFTLDPGAPPGATLDPSTGVLQWSPAATDTGTTNLFTVRVTDDGQPSLSDAETFQVAVLPQSIRLRLAREGSVLTLSWDSQPGTVYSVQYKSALDDPEWLMLADVVIATGPTASKPDSIDGQTQRFYRVVIGP